MFIYGVKTGISNIKSNFTTYILPTAQFQGPFRFQNTYLIFQEQIESLKQEMDTLKKRCERVEKEKSDILLRRLANIDTVNKYSSGRSSEVLKLQQKVNELTSQNEDLRDEKKHLTLRVKEIEGELEVSL